MYVAGEERRVFGWFVWMGREERLGGLEGSGGRERLWKGRVGICLFVFFCFLICLFG